MADLRGPDHIADKLTIYLYFSVASLVAVLALWLHFDVSFPGSCFLFGLLTILLGLSSFVFWDMVRMKPSRTLDLKSVSQFYLLKITMFYIAKRMLKNEYEPCTKRVQEQQRTYLLKLLKHNENTEYGRKYEISKIKTVDEYKAAHPLTVYEHYLPYIERTVKGEKNIQFPDEVVYYAMTSGTTGKNKRIPITEFEASNCVRHYLLALPELGKLNSWREATLKKFMTVKHYVPERRTDLGVRMGPISYLSRLRNPTTDTDTSPLPCWDIEDDDASMYVQVLFGLYNRDVEYFIGIFPSGLARFFNVLEQNVEELCQDLARGRIREDIELDEEMREKLNKQLRPWPERAEEVKIICGRGNEAVAKQLWPDIKIVTVIQDGPFRHLAKTILEKQLSGIETTTFSHGATEGNYGFPVPYGRYGNDRRNERIYSFNPMDGFFEFIRLKDFEEEQPETKCLHELKDGETYELVISNYRGLYRYRTHDVVQIIYHYNEMPLYKFAQRRGDVLNISVERTPQVIMERCIEKATEKLNIVPKDFTATESLTFNKLLDDKAKSALGDYKSLPGFYVLFVELENDEMLSEDASQVFDDVLMDIFENYRSLRKRGQIEQMRVAQVKSGTFHELTQQMVNSNPHTTFIQFKMPKVMRTEEFLEVLLDNVVA